MPSKIPSAPGLRIQTRRSGVHGKGVFAIQDIAEGETVIEYRGEVISWKEALRRHPHDPAQPNHTFYFHIDDKNVIDGKVTGNAAKWINHSCEPNCEADEVDGRIFIIARRNIAAGEELNYDYGLIIDLPYTKSLKAEFPCWCGSADCRGTLLSPKPRKKKDKKKTKSEAKKKAGGKSKASAKPESKAVAEKAIKKPGKKATDKVAKPAKKAAGSSAKTLAKTGEKAGAKTIVKTAKKAAKKATKKVAGKTAAPIAKQPATKAARKAAKR